MKPARAALIVWLGNLALLAVLSALLWQQAGNTKAERQATDEAIANLETRQPRIAWQDDVRRETFTLGTTRLSPIERPKPEQPPIKITPPPPKVEKTDDQLRDELEAALNKRFRLQRMMLSSSDDYPNIAVVVADGVRLQWFKDMNLLDEYGNAKSPALRKLALDATVKRIDTLGVLLDAASLEKPEKRFEILLVIKDEKLPMGMLSADYVHEGPALRITDQPVDPDHDWHKAEGWGYPIPEDKQPKVDEFIKHTRVTERGLEILDTLPEDSPARKYGARGGEVIKTINGKSVKSMSDVRRVVREEYNAGATEFIVGFERDGVPETATIKLPKR